MIDFQKAYQEQLQENLETLLRDLKIGKIDLKIKVWAEKFGYNFELIKEKAIQDEIFRCVFAKDPSKQNLYQNIAAEYIRSLEMVEDFQVFASGEKYLIGGEILHGKSLETRKKEASMIHFQWSCSNSTFYAVHIYTGKSGGTQDSRRKGIQKFLDNAKEFNQKDTFFLAICDGSYYERKDSKMDGESNLKVLEDSTDEKKTFCLNIEKLEEFLSQDNLTSPPWA